jgi:hypothetical protein
MFDPLDDQIKHDEGRTPKQWLGLALTVFVLAVVLFGGLYMLVRMSE